VTGSDERWQRRDSRHIWGSPVPEGRGKRVHRNVYTNVQMCMRDRICELRGGRIGTELRALGMGLAEAMRPLLACFCTGGRPGSARMAGSGRRMLMVCSWVRRGSGGAEVQ